MKICTWILTIGLAASAWAQNPAPKAQATPKPPAAAQQSAAKPSVSSPAKTAAPVANAAPAAKNAAPAASAAKSAKPAPAAKQASASGAAAKSEKAAKQTGKQTAKQAKASRKKSPEKKSAEKASPEKASSDKASPDKTVEQANSVHKGHRDPFVSPIVERPGALCTGAGKRCLYIGDLSLIGIVESSNGVIAVVASGQHTYFLREHDPLADGEVERITSDAITMRQRASDLLGRPVEREITRKIGMPAV